MSEELNIEASVNDIAADLGLGASDAPQNDPVDDDQDDDAPLDTGAAPADDAPADVTTAPETPVTRAAPKSWAKEQHEHWSKLDPKVQEYIELREKQAEEGITRYSRELRPLSDAIAPYQDVIKASGTDAPTAIKALMEAHKQMSVPDEGQRAAYFAKMAKHYGIDVTRLGQAAQMSDEPAAVKELRERTERIEREHRQRSESEQKAVRERVASEVSAFADAKDDKGQPKHPYFDECAEHIVALINAGHTLDQAYEQAIWANPVTRAKENARLQSESEASLRAKAKKEAETARTASRANVNSRDTRRAPQASKAGNWEETLETTMQEIKARTH